jgi:TolA-binding protein
MKKIVALFVLLGVVLATPVYSADDNQGSSWWEILRKKIEMLTPRKKMSTTTAVGGVRGSMADAEDVYWKGEADNQPVDEEELAAFKKAIDLYESGNPAGAKAGFADFITKHPDSRLRADAEQAMAQLQGKK